ncbi:proline-rich receptor-like protein kinase PERK9 [Amphibalanus amphitrite]|uniref:proline-rich receptor-like protein kinase PERK9 n=1 Tax=Amphibalanus amphitrite TaxID=1232801 RepID=UPI001C9125FD|nr:proline-rich receptor-like protein kinase PERK9 [Amphibalanus amphitrite]
MREPVRAAPPPPGGRPATIIRASASEPSIKRSVLDAVGPRAAPARPARGPAPAQPPAPRRAGVRPPPKKKPPPRPPPPKFQEFSRRDTPPTYEQVLREDAAVLAGFGFGGERNSAPSAPPLGGDLIDFDAPVPAAPVPAVPLTWDSPPPARRVAPSPAPAAAPAAAAAPLPAVTVIRPAKSSTRRVRPSSTPPTPAPSDERDASPPMPSCPPPPPPTIGWMSATPAVKPPPPPPRPGSSASATEPARAVALYDFQSSEAGDLSFHADDTIHLVERVNAEWLRGRCGSRQGIFPEAYVQILVPLLGEPEPEPQAAPEPGHGEGALVLYDFSPQEASDLALTAGERVQVQGRLNDEWGYGTVAGRSGQFPLAFVDVQPDQLPLL